MQETRPEVPPKPLDRSVSQRAPLRQPGSHKEELERSASHRISPSASRSHIPNLVPSRAPPQRPARPGDPPPPPAPKDPSPPVSEQGPGVVPRRREPKPKPTDGDVVERLKSICTDADPSKLYRNLVKIGQGSVKGKSEVYFLANLAGQCLGRGLYRLPSGHQHGGGNQTDEFGQTA
jgi:hypothetical protein